MSKIQPKVETETKSYEVASFKVQVDYLELFKYVNLRIELYDATEYLHSVKHIRLEGDEYLAWLNDDNYLIHKVAEKLGFTLAE